MHSFLHARIWSWLLPFLLSLLRVHHLLYFSITSEASPFNSLLTSPDSSCVILLHSCILSSSRRLRANIVYQFTGYHLHSIPCFQLRPTQTRLCPRAFVKETCSHQTIHAWSQPLRCDAISVRDTVAYGHPSKHRDLYDRKTSIVLSLCGGINMPRILTV